MKNLKIVFVLFLLFSNVAFSQNKPVTAVIAGKVTADSLVFKERKPYSVVAFKNRELVSEYLLDDSANTFRLNIPLEELHYIELMVNTYPDIQPDSIRKMFFYWDSCFFPLLNLNKFFPELLGVSLTMEPYDSLFIDLQFRSYIEKKVVHIGVKTRTWKRNMGLFKCTLSGSKYAVGNNTYLLQRYKKPGNREEVGYSGGGMLRIGGNINHGLYKLPIEKALHISDSIFQLNYNWLEKFKNMLSDQYYTLQKANIIYANINQKHSLVRAHLYSDTASIIEIKKEARKLYGFMDSVEFKDEYLISSPYKEFINNYMEYLQRIIRGKDISSKKINPYYLAKASLSGKSREWFLNNSIVAYSSYGIAENQDLYLDYINEYPNSIYSQKLTEIYNAHKAILPGSRVPNLNINRTNNNVTDLKHFRGDVVVLISDNILLNNWLQNRKIYKDTEKLMSKFSKYGVKFILLEAHPEEIGREKQKEEMNDLFYGIAKNANNPKNLLPFQFENNMTNFYVINKKGIIQSVSPSYVELHNTLVNLIKEPYMSTSIVATFLQKNPHFIDLSIFLILAIGIVSFLYFNIKRKQQNLKRLQLQSELKAIRSQLSPHFLFNSLNSIQNHINKCDSETAEIQLSKFALLMRKVLEISEQDSITLKEEIDFISSYIELEKARFRFDFQLNVHPNLDVYNTEIPSMLIQPFVENAIKHAMSELGCKGALEVDVGGNTKDNSVSFKITDNGKGLKDTNKSGFGLKSSLERINIINSQSKNKIDIKIDSPVNDHGGTCIILKIPKKY